MWVSMRANANAAKKRLSKIAGGKLSRALVFRGSTVKTMGGLEKTDEQ